VLEFLSRSSFWIARRSHMKQLAELNDSQNLPPGSVRAAQEKAFLEIIEHARSNVPWYREALGDLDIRSLDDITSIPFLTKKMIQAGTDRLKAEGLPPERFIPNTTGGSTGEKLEMYSDAASSRFAILMRSNMWTGWSIGEKQLQLWGAHSDLSNAQGLKQRISGLFFNRNRMLSSYDMTEHDMRRYVEIINRNRPRLITGYSSALYLLTRFIRTEGLKIYSPKGVICSAETLQDEQRETIESVFGCGVFNRYGCREVGNIAQECQEHNGLHINAEKIIVEVVDEAGRACRPGETGEIVVTDLDNYVFPFIRYRIGDIGALSDRTCPCGRGLPMLESVDGRVWDVIIGANGSRVIGTLWLVEGVDGIRQYQIIQPEHGKLTLRLVVTGEFSEESRSELIRRVKDKCGGEMAVKIDMVDDIPLTGSGKRRLVISNVSPFIE
jgi:phenylacetate-CoA ligase